MQFEQTADHTRVTSAVRAPEPPERVRYLQALVPDRIFRHVHDCAYKSRMSLRRYLNLILEDATVYTVCGESEMQGAGASHENQSP